MEKERDLDASVFWRFALSGAVCCGTAHAFLVPLDVVKTKMQVGAVTLVTVTATLTIQRSLGLDRGRKGTSCIGCRTHTTPLSDTHHIVQIHYVVSLTH